MSTIAELLPQPASDRTTRTRNSLKQGVVRVPRVIRMIVMPDGREIPWEDASQEDRQRIVQRFMDELIVPMAYESIMRDLQREREAAN